jgi:hypothetical protein
MAQRERASSERVYSPWKLSGIVVRYSYPNRASRMPLFLNKFGMESVDPSQLDKITQTKSPEKN